MPDLNEPSCWRAAAITFAVCAGLLLVISLVVSGGATTVAVS
ncbi:MULTISPECIES: hypothetical protein [Afifella]|nr:MULTISPECIES: hypothetical protein [Afifella]MCT8265872.1 hypothetical protein [Afifella sp. JA880]